MMVQKHRTTAVRRKQIIAAARKLIVKYGGEHVTVRRLAKEVGISEGAIYRHFKSKKDILSLLADEIEQSLIEDITRFGSQGRTSLETLDDALRSHLSAIERRHGVSFQVIAEIISLGDKKLNKRIAEAIDKYRSRLKDLLSEAMKSGEVRKDIDLEAAATLLFAMVQGLVNLWALDNYGFDPEEKYESLWRIFRDAVVAR